MSSSRRDMKMECFAFVGMKIFFPREEKNLTALMTLSDVD